MTRRYVAGDTVPKSVKAGRKLMHNHIMHADDMPCGVNGFRAWTDTKLAPGFVRCNCGWSGLPHCAAFGDYKCHTLMELEVIEPGTMEQVWDAQDG
jgi:hypothetical protein